MHVVKVRDERGIGPSVQIHHWFHHLRPPGRSVVVGRERVQPVNQKYSFFDVAHEGELRSKTQRKLKFLL